MCYHLIYHEYKAPTKPPWPTLQIFFRDAHVSWKTISSDIVNKHLCTNVIQL